MPIKKNKVELKYGFPYFTKKQGLLRLCDSQKLIISDIWAFWDYVIKKSNFSRQHTIFMNSLLEQAKFFYTTAEKSPVKSQPLLYYYSFMNLAKVLINLEESSGRINSEYRHGIKDLKHQEKFSHATIEIHEVKENVINISAELSRFLGDQVITSKEKFNIKELLSYCTGIHRTFSEIFNQKEVFFRVENIELFKQGKIMIMEGEVKCTSQQAEDLTRCGYSIYEEDNKFIWRETHLMLTNKIRRIDYYEFSKLLRSKGMWYLIGSSGYISYISSVINKSYSPEFIIYNVMFYLGSISRYKPHLFDDIFSANELWLMSEFLATQPKQFLYTVTAKALSQHVLKAYADF